jgi:hypothetical protein
VNGGRFDPRTGKKWRKRMKSLTREQKQAVERAVIVTLAGALDPDYGEPLKDIYEQRDYEESEATEAYEEAFFKKIYKMFNKGKIQDIQTK